MTRTAALADFVGDWRLTRRIDDARTGQVALAEGLARFVPSATGLIYDETLRLKLPGQAPMTATRRYLWQADGDGIAVLFDDGRPFHRIALGEEAWEDTHWCAPDNYRGSYDFGDWPRWISRWAVTGPRKEYFMVTTYDRP
ncbi:hypothetical protein AVO45_06695 [Ruegeria marisrubri]|uniref:DUF6314 domain-containing protein n=1 Tax=Ruegeria marisrubri TaxID=1685379 RepID=A0A0X3TY95_9RHOB|nr:DUF6314 family protein [Ruegeria marisrubri]KUJ80715.1 hypothetical protein AVO45_06695 [Ruegeria marisrubri]